jgi:transcriptional regulator with PAS, ATPase and Fis domain
MKNLETTVEELEHDRRAIEEDRPGIVLVYSLERARLDVFPLEEGSIEIGRAMLEDDDRVSRRHARVRFERGRWTIEDLESRNGTFVDGVRVLGSAIAESPKVIRAGRSLFIADANVKKYEGGVDLEGAVVAGPKLKQAWSAIDRAAQFGDTVFIRGESGAGKELAARRFHAAAGKESDPFVAVNCAAIPEGLAERLLFGAKKGAYSGAVSDADGYLQTASGGTLFLDEIAELDLAVQAKLLRVLENKEVMALGDAAPRKIEIRVCSATHRDLRESVAQGKFREDLYFRVGRPEVQLPPLRDRVEEVPWHVVGALERLSRNLIANASLVESCMLRRWPGNVRELASEVRRAAQEAAADSRSLVEAGDLAPDAGAGFGQGAPLSAREHAIRAREASSAAIEEPAAERARELPRDRVESALRTERGNVTRAAKRLGLHRNQLRRWLAKNEVDPRSYGDDGGLEAGEPPEGGGSDGE